jgi:hypothetical protein
LVAGWEQRVEEQAALSAELSRRMQQASATVDSDDGAAAVTVDYSGGLADLRLTERAMRLSPGELAEVILATSRRAQAKMAQEMTAVVQGMYGSGSQTASFIAGAYAEQFPEPPDEQERGRR